MFQYENGYYAAVWLITYPVETTWTRLYVKSYVKNAVACVLRAPTSNVVKSGAFTEDEVNGF